MAAPQGNQNAAKAKVWSDAVRKVGIRRGALESLANKLWDMALEGDMQAIKEVGDRIEGKPAQAITGDGGGPVLHRVEQVIVDPAD